MFLSSFESSPVLIIAAHPDDEVLGCGATIARFADSSRAVHVLYVATGAASRFAEPALHSQIINNQIAALKNNAHQVAKMLCIESQTFLDFPDNRLDTVPLMDLAHCIKKVVLLLKPSVVFTHHFGDYNWDHTRVYEATLMACRANAGEFYPTELYSYEVLSSTERAPAEPHRAFMPQLFVDVTQTIQRKVDALKLYESELGIYPHPRSPEAVLHLAGFRGSQVGIHFAEAFRLVRCIR